MAGSDLKLYGLAVRKNLQEKSRAMLNQNCELELRDQPKTWGALLRDAQASGSCGRQCLGGPGGL